MRRQAKARVNDQQRTQRGSGKSAKVAKSKGIRKDRLASTPYRRPSESVVQGLNRKHLDELLQQYHILADKGLRGTIHPQEARELQRIEEELQRFEDAETAEREKGIEERHRMLMQELRELTFELRRFNSEQGT